jgi:hypothetical protein
MSNSSGSGGDGNEFGEGFEGFEGFEGLSRPYLGEPQYVLLRKIVDGEVSEQGKEIVYGPDTQIDCGFWMVENMNKYSECLLSVVPESYAGGLINTGRRIFGADNSQHVKQLSEKEEKIKLLEAALDSEKNLAELWENLYHESQTDLKESAMMLRNHLINENERSRQQLEKFQELIAKFSR